jgi:hypothetical protein
MPQKFSPIAASLHSRRLHPVAQTGRLRMTLDESRNRAIAEGGASRRKAALADPMVESPPPSPLVPLKASSTRNRRSSGK